MNNEFDPIEQELKSLHPRGLSGRAVARIRHELEPAPARWPWWLAFGAAAAGVALLLAFSATRNPKASPAVKAPEPSASLIVAREYDGVVLLDHEGPYRRVRYHVARANATGPSAEVVVLQKASLD
jgi:hypothetical protein